MPGFSLLNAGELTKPATVLIEKISNAVGTLWEPRQMRRVAQAKADAAMILAKNEIDIDEVKFRAASRFVEEETKRQLNMESVLAKALPEVDSNARTEDVEDDWITNFFEKCRSVSDNQMQLLWSRILSGESNAPGSFSRKTVNLMGDMDKASAELFRTLCSFGWTIESTFAPLIYDFRDKIYTNQGLTLFLLGQLDSIGLIQINPATGFNLSNQPKVSTATYHGRSVLLTFPKEKANELDVGSLILTPSGRQLSQIVKPSPIDGFFEFVYDKWASESLLPTRQAPI